MPLDCSRPAARFGTLAKAAALLTVLSLGTAGAGCSSDTIDETDGAEADVSAKDPILGRWIGTGAFAELRLERGSNGYQNYIRRVACADCAGGYEEQYGRWSALNQGTALTLTRNTGRERRDDGSWNVVYDTPERFGYTISASGELSLEDAAGAIVAKLRKFVREPPGGTPDPSLPIDKGSVAFADDGGSWFRDQGQPGLAFSVTNASGKTYTVQQIDLWFGNGKPVTFATDSLLSQWEPYAGNSFRITLFQNGETAHLSSSLNDSGRIEIAEGNAAFVPFASGALHVVARGVLGDEAQRWEAEVTLSNP